MLASTAKMLQPMLLDACDKYTVQHMGQSASAYLEADVIQTCNSSSNGQGPGELSPAERICLNVVSNVLYT